MGDGGMTSDHWVWAAAKATGSSHVAAQRGCDDAGACLEVETATGPVLIAIASDGAGSASRSSTGSFIVVSRMVRSIVSFLGKPGKYVGHITEEIVQDWLDEIREILHVRAQSEKIDRREYAATLVCAIVSKTEATIIHVGDGSVVTKAKDEDHWEVRSWPMQGEYAATTYFVTDQVVRQVCLNLPERIEAIAVFTDGIERLVLDFTNMQPSHAFFDKMIKPLDANGAGRLRSLSKQLQAYLDSKDVLARTDDDKTLILARRKLG